MKNDNVVMSKSFAFALRTIKYGDSFVFGDGRHRCLAAKFIGAETIPIDCIR